MYNGGSLGKAWAGVHHRVCRNKSTSEFEEVVSQGGHSEQKLEETVAVWAGQSNDRHHRCYITLCRGRGQWQSVLMRGSDSRQVGTTHGAGGHNVFQWLVFIA